MAQLILQARDQSSMQENLEKDVGYAFVEEYAIKLGI